MQTQARQDEPFTLLTNCLCGMPFFDRDRIHGIDVLECRACGVKRQDLPGYTKQMYFDYYKTDYHTKEQQKIGLQAYKERYAHDLSIAEMRLKNYEEMLHLQGGEKFLDIGSSNNAFVDYMNANGYACKGIEIGEEGKKHPETTYTEDLLDLKLKQGSFDVVTLHDVFEHLLYPEAYLQEIKRILGDYKFMILDLPNYFVPEGVHHWRPVQHLWFFTREQTIQILQNNGFKVLCVREPIASKLVFYCQAK